MKTKKAEKVRNNNKTSNEAGGSHPPLIHQIKIHSIPDEYKLAIDRQEKESDRFWSRSNIMLLVQGALISFYIGLKSKDNLFGIFTAIEGMILAVIWLAVLAKGKSYVSRWDHVIETIEDKSKVTSEIQYPLNNIYRNAKDSEKLRFKWFWGKSTTKLMQYAVISILLFWIAAISLSLTIGIDEVKISKNKSTLLNQVVTKSLDNASPIPKVKIENSNALKKTKAPIHDKAETLPKTKQ